MVPQQFGDLAAALQSIADALLHHAAHPQDTPTPRAGSEHGPSGCGASGVTSGPEPATIS